MLENSRLLENPFHSVHHFFAYGEIPKQCHISLYFSRRIFRIPHSVLATLPFFDIFQDQVNRVLSVQQPYLSTDSQPPSPGNNHLTTQ